MHWLDTSALSVLAGVALIGAVVGFVRPALRVATIALAFAAAWWLSPFVAEQVAVWVEQPVSPSLVAGATFTVALVILSVVVALGRRRFWEQSPEWVLKLTEWLRWADRLAGAVAAMALAATVLAAAVYFADLHSDSPAKSRLDGSVTLRHARVRVEAAVASLSDAEKARLKEAVEWFKQRSTSAAR